MSWDFHAALLNVALLCILTVPHEFAHAWVATRLGDDTPEREGRLTLYPPAHIDLWGTLILPVVATLLGGGLLGWGRPVNTVVSRLRFGWSGLALVALAGPASNILLAMIFIAASIAAADVFADLADFSRRAAALSVYLALFNMIPIPPLDGSKLLLALRLPAAVYEELARFGFLLLIVGLAATRLGVWLSWASFAVTQALFGLFY